MVEHTDERTDWGRTYIRKNRLEKDIQTKEQTKEEHRRKNRLEVNVQTEEQNMSEHTDGRTDS